MILGKWKGEILGQTGIWEYKGELQADGKPCGWGIAIHKYLLVEYEGTWLDGQRHGLGQIKDLYFGVFSQGEWRAGSKHGKSTYFSQNSKSFLKKSRYLPVDQFTMRNTTKA